MSRIFLQDAIADTDTIAITGENARYLSTVLRSIPGDTLIITDRNHNSFSAHISSVTKKVVTVTLVSRLSFDTESPLQIVLLQGLLKGTKMDFVIQKATELGVSKIIPVVTERSQIRQTRKLARWKKIAEDASRQSGRNVVPKILHVIDFAKLFTGKGKTTKRGILFWEEGGESVSSLMKRFEKHGAISLFVGPEGGFTEGEVKTASGEGFLKATFGKRILRAETAALAAVSIFQYELGDLGTSTESHLLNKRAL